MRISPTMSSPCWAGSSSSATPATKWSDTSTSATTPSMTSHATTMPPPRSLAAASTCPWLSCSGSRRRVRSNRAMPSIYIQTYGCQMNEADSERVLRGALALGYRAAEHPEDASVLVLNTCTVRDNAEARAYGRIGQWKALKAQDPAVRLVVMGCLAEQDRDVMPGKVPYVDAIFGTREIDAVVARLAQWRDNFVDGDDGGEDRLAALEGYGTVRHDDAHADPRWNKLRAFVTVQQGCSYYCTFCIVPMVRGRFEDRTVEAVMADLRERLDRGAREVMLVGQTVNHYHCPQTGARFADLLELVAAEERVERLTFISPHPNDFDEHTFQVMGQIGKLNQRLHLPLQSASNAVLKRMNRKYTIERYREQVALFRKYCRGWALTTDLIVGFPGESEEMFEETLAFVNEGTFQNGYTFIYSPRRGTQAAQWSDQFVDPAVAGVRLRRLAEAQDRLTRAYHRSLVGTTQRALIVGPSKKDPERYATKIGQNVTVIVPKQSLDNPWLDVRIDKAYTWGTLGTVLGTAAHAAAPARAVAHLLPPLEGGGVPDEGPVVFDTVPREAAAQPR
ncbi:tRNA (N6-isopentenyl adenosine(37)-C2)-methylthiotransferase MiaB [bacterium]|nr:MAG: tRNA (N6-isopentenyl adenosine(37)-C2)-methylthiotransferase MiaB [bacterium]